MRAHICIDLEDENEKAECAARNEMASDQKTRYVHTQLYIYT